MIPSAPKSTKSLMQTPHPRNKDGWQRQPPLQNRTLFILVTGVRGRRAEANFAQYLNEKIQKNFLKP